MKTLFFLFVVCVFIVSGVSALTISPVRYNETSPVGSTIVFSIALTPDNSDERTIETVSVSGDCSEWVTVTPSAPVPLPATFKVSASIPGDASNGRHRCDLGFIQPTTGMISAIIGFPLTFNVSGGIEPTLKAPVQEEPAPLPTSAPAQPASTEPMIPLKTAGTALIVVVAAMFCIVIIYDSRRGKK
jgi:hypothetical protein